MASTLDINPLCADEIADLDAVVLSQHTLARNRLRGQVLPLRGILFANRADSIHLVHLPVNRAGRAGPTVYSIDTDFYVQDAYHCLFKDSADAHRIRYLTTANGHQFFVCFCPMQCPDVYEEYLNLKNDVLSAQVKASFPYAQWFGNVLVLKTKYTGVVDATPEDVDVIAASVYTFCQNYYFEFESRYMKGLRRMLKPAATEWWRELYLYPR